MNRVLKMGEGFMLIPSPSFIYYDFVKNVLPLFEHVSSLLIFPVSPNAPTLVGAYDET